MKLILRNQVIQAAETDSKKGKRTAKSVIAITLAAAVTGVNYYFQNFINKA